MAGKTYGLACYKTDKKQGKRCLRLGIAPGYSASGSEKDFCQTQSFQVLLEASGKKDTRKLRRLVRGIKKWQIVSEETLNAAEHGWLSFPERAPKDTASSEDAANGKVAQPAAAAETVELKMPQGEAFVALVNDEATQSYQLQARCTPEELAPLVSCLIFHAAERLMLSEQNTNEEPLVLAEKAVRKMSLEALERLAEQYGASGDGMLH